MNTSKEIWLKIKIKMKDIIGNTNCKRIYILIIEKLKGFVIRKSMIVLMKWEKLVIKNIIWRYFEM